MSLYPISSLDNIHSNTYTVQTKIVLTPQSVHNHVDTGVVLYNNDSAQSLATTCHFNSRKSVAKSQSLVLCSYVLYNYF